jgi:WD40 repeat protein
MLVLKGHKDPIQRVAFSPDGRTLMSVDRMDHVRVWDTPGGALRWSVDDGFFNSAAFSPDGRHVITVNRDGNRATDGAGQPRSAFDRENPVLLRDIATGAVTPLQLACDHSLTPFGLKFSTDGTRCVAQNGYSGDLLNWWAYPSWEPLPSWNLLDLGVGRFRSFVFSPDGKTLAGMNGGGVRLMDVASGAVRHRHPFPVVQEECRLAYHPGGTLLAVGSGTRLAILDTETMAEVGEVRQAKKYFLDAAFSPDGRRLATVSNEETVKVWDTSSWGLSAEFAWSIGGLRCVAYCPDGATAATGGMKKAIVLWDTE